MLPRRLSILVLTFATVGLQLAACAQNAEHKAWLDDMDRRHTVVVETMSGTGGM